MLSIVTDANNLLMRRNLGTATNAVNIALQRMSTGYKINSAKDDAAGMYVATRLNTQIRGLKQAQKNVQDGMSILQTAEGAYSNITDILLRLRELSLQASNGIYDKASRDAMQLEADELTAELRRIQESTSFNGLSLFNNPPSESAAAMPALASTLNILDMSTSGDGVVEQSNNSRSTFSLLRSSAPMMMSASPASSGGNDGVALMSVDDEGVATASTITSTAYDFTASQTQTITVGEGEHQRIYTVKNKQTTTSSLTINYDTGTGQITFLGQNFEIRATEMDKTHNLIINGGSNTVYAGNMADRVEVIGEQQSKSNIVYGLEGNDILITNAQATTIRGGNGEDKIYLNCESYVYGDADNDTIYVNHASYAYANGGDGDDTFYVDAKGSTSGTQTRVLGDAGNDKFYTTENTQYISIDGGDGYNQIDDLGSNNTKVKLYDFDGNDVSSLYAVEFTGKNHTQTITIDGKNYEVTCGNNSYKTFYYSIKDGVITFDSLSQYFTIKGEANKQHNVILDGGSTTFYAGNLNDIIQIKKGNCVVYGGDGDDTITKIGDGSTKIYGEDGKDTITATGILPYNDSLIDGGNSSDTITLNGSGYTSIGMGSVFGGDGDDVFNVNNGYTVVAGDGGNDTYNFKAGTVNNVVIDNNENGDTNVINTNGTDVLTSGFDGSKGVAITFAIGETKEITLDNGITYQITNNLDRENQFMYYYDPITFETSFAGSRFTIVGEENSVHNIRLYGDNNTLTTGNKNDTVVLYGNYNTLNTLNGDDNITHNGWINNAINAGIGDDTITLATRCDGVVSGEEGNDKFIINGSARNVTGGAGDDEYVLNYQGAKVTDSDGNNVFEVNANNCTVTGGTGNDTFTVNGTGNNITCGGGNDYVLLNAAGNTVTGGTGDNYFVNTDPDLENDMTNIVKNPNSDAIGFTTAGEVKTFTVGDKTYTVTNTGADGTSNATNSVSYNYNQNTGELTLTGSNFSVVTEDANQNLVIKGSNNSITTGSGNDNVVVSSGEGNIINTNAGADKITSNTANNAISSGEGNDSITLNASSGSKLVDAGNGDNTITINSNGNTNIVAGDGKNNLNVSGSTNTITLGNGANTAVMSGTGNTITAGNGNNKLSSVNGGNNINVGSGNNTLGLQGDNNTATTLGGTNTFNVNGNSNTIDTEGNGNYNITGSNNIVDTQKSGTFKVRGDENTITSAFGSGNYTINGDGNRLTVQQGNQDVSITGNSNVYTSLSGSSDIKAKGDLNTITTTDGTNTFDVKGSDNEIVGGSGADEIEVSGSNNTISGNDGDDYLMIGGGSNNQLDGGSGENIMINGGANTTYQNVVDMTPTPLHVRLQVGANAGDSIDFDLSFNLFNFEVDFSDIESSLDSLEDIDEMLNTVSSQRASVGAIMNRLESVLQSQTTSIENYTAAKSTIMDADIAKESAELVKNQILQQTTAALMAQAKRNRADIIMRLLR